MVRDTLAFTSYLLPISLLCLTSWSELVLVIVNTRREIKINESSNSEWKKKSLGRDREGKRGWPESSHLLRFDRKKGKSERDFVCLFWEFPSPLPSMSCAMTNSRVRQQPSRRLSSCAIFTYALLVFLEHFFFLSRRRACVWFMRREANLKSPLTPLSNAPLFFFPPSSYSIRRDNIDSRLSHMKLFGRERNYDADAKVSCHSFRPLQIVSWAAPSRVNT